MSTYRTLHTHVQQRLLRITLNRPDKRHALNETLLTELRQVLQQAQRDPDVGALILIGEGPAFCAGADIEALLPLDGPKGLLFAQQGQSVCRLLEQCGKPSVAAVNGYAFGGGCELAMSATLRIASEYARFGQPEVKLGVIPGFGGTQRLARLVGKGRALELCLTGRTLDSQEAWQWGLVNQVVTGENLLAAAETCLQTILQHSPHAISQTMQAIDRGFDLPLDAAMAVEATHFSLACTHPDKDEGVRAFLDKREPQFQTPSIDENIF